MAAAAATLLVVVPAKPLRAKQRLAAPRISWRRKSEVMRRLDMGRVSNHSPWQSQGNILRRIKGSAGGGAAGMGGKQKGGTPDFGAKTGEIGSAVVVWRRAAPLA